MKSLTLKITVVILTVSFLAILSMGLLARWTTSRQFNNFISSQAQETVLAEVTEQFESAGSWGNFIQTAGGPSNFRDMAGGYGVASAEGLVVIPGGGLRPRETVPVDRFNEALPIMAGDEEVGRLLVPRDSGRGRPPSQGQNAQENFLANVNVALRYAGLATIVAALLLSVLLSRSLTNPIKKLTQATEAVASGNLNYHVEVTSKDELGKLANSFNKMSADLAQSQALRQQMTADIAHDLRTPLSIIMGHTEALQDGVFPATKETFDIIHDEAMRLNRLIEDLRTLSLAETGELPLHKQQTDLSELLKTVCSAYLPVAQQKQVGLRLDVVDGLLLLDVDVDRMTQVFNNLLDNALRYTPEGGEVVLKSAVYDQTLQIQISDTGAGIPADDLPHIFERFYRADKSRQRKDGGSGLGLAITKSIVQAHDGTISVTSQQGQGTTFTVLFPL